MLEILWIEHFYMYYFLTLWHIDVHALILWHFGTSTISRFGFFGILDSKLGLLFSLSMFGRLLWWPQNFGCSRSLALRRWHSDWSSKFQSWAFRLGTSTAIVLRHFSFPSFLHFASLILRPFYFSALKYFDSSTLLTATMFWQIQQPCESVKRQSYNLTYSSPSLVPCALLEIHVKEFEYPDDSSALKPSALWHERRWKIVSVDFLWRATTSVTTDRRCLLAY